jgi:hypothetical protein
MKAAFSGYSSLKGGNMSIHDIENALDAGLLWACMSNGNLWRLRRNGRTKLWKTRPSDYRIPVKAGLKATGAITQDSVIVPDPDAVGRFIVERV